VRLFAKLFLLLTLCAAVPLAFTAGAALWRTRALSAQLTAASERAGETGADAGERALFTESRRVHLRVVEVRAAELQEFFEQGRKLVQLQSSFARRALTEAADPAGPPLISDSRMAQLVRDPGRRLCARALTWCTDSPRASRSTPFAGRWSDCPASATTTRSPSARPLG
jgi:hypothetical protein